jgi:hypothetical protein
MVAIKAHFDGKNIIPEEPLDLPKNKTFIVRIDTAESMEKSDKSIFDWIEQNVIKDESLPSDLSYQHDHYLYGKPKKAD